MKRRSQLILILPNKKTYHDNDEIAIDFRWSNVKEDEEDIVLANLIESLQKHADDENFPKK